MGGTAGFEMQNGKTRRLLGTGLSVAGYLLVSVVFFFALATRHDSPALRMMLKSLLVLTGICVAVAIPAALVAFRVSIRDRKAKGLPTVDWASVRKSIDDAWSGFWLFVGRAFIVAVGLSLLTGVGWILFRLATKFLRWLSTD